MRVYIKRVVYIRIYHGHEVDTWIKEGKALTELTLAGGGGGGACEGKKPPQRLAVLPHPQRTGPLHVNLRV